MSAWTLTAEVNFKIKYTSVCFYVKSLNFVRMVLEVYGWNHWDHILFSGLTSLCLCSYQARGV